MDNLQKLLIDDSLITDIRVKESWLTMEGIIIFGRQVSNQQWVAPFVFKTNLVEEMRIDTSSFSFLFGTTDDHYLTYENFIGRSKIFDIPSNNDWKYEICSHLD